jgi:hypothetical protein
VTFILQIHRAAEPPEVWETLRKSKNCGKLAERARNLVKLFRLRPKEGCDAARVLLGKSIASRFTVRWDRKALSA